MQAEQANRRLRQRRVRRARQDAVQPRRRAASVAFQRQQLALQTGVLGLSLDHVLLRRKPHSVASLGNTLKLIHQRPQLLGDLDGCVGILVFVEGKLDETPELDSAQALAGRCRSAPASAISRASPRLPPIGKV